MKKRIFYHDTDCGGVVYYGNYLKYLEEARTEYLEKKGLDIKKLADSGIWFAVARQEIDYEAPAKYGDMLEIETVISEIKKIKIVFDCVIKNQDGKTVAKAKTIMACVDPDLKLLRMPENVRKALI